MSSSDLAPVLVFASMMVAVAWIVWVIANNKRRARIAELQREMHAKLIEKFGTSQDLLECLKTDAGSRLLDSATIEQSRPFGRILGSVQAGLILFMLGIAMLIVRYTIPAEGFNAIEHAQTAHGMLALSLLLLALGVGFLLSAAASYRLSKSWGLMDGDFASKR
jgi:DMSO/TMAO reductase YedYZ heme-binding membrane subunit